VPAAGWLVIGVSSRRVETRREEVIAMSPGLDLTFTRAVDLLARYRRGRAPPLDVVEALLQRIDRVNPRVNAIVTLARESALADARRATRALRRGGRECSARS